MYDRVETELARMVKKQIRQEGPMTFRDFMAQALFAPGLGFYATGPKIGTPGGAFNTNAMFPAFAYALTRAIEVAEEQLQERLRIVECGGGTGELGRRIQSYLREPHEYVVIETSPALRTQQQSVGLHSVPSPSSLSPEPTFLFGNEVLDALPIHRILGDGNRAIQEQYVDLDKDGDFLEVFREPSSPLLQERLNQEGVFLGRGHLAEICLDLPNFLSQVSTVVSKGYLLFIDYGDEALNLYHFSRPNGSLRCFYRQSQVYDPFDRVGEQDLTADVDFTAVYSAAQEAGLEVVGHQSQGQWLRTLELAETWPASLPPMNSQAFGIDEILSPTRLGTAFDVLGFTTGGIPSPPGFAPSP